MTITQTMWAPLTAENRPWTRWWWMGNALTEAEVTRHLELFQAAGFGGVEVSPIYGPPGSEDRFVPFLSPRWVELFAHTSREAKRLHLGVDLIAGTGWPFGGPQVNAADSACVVWTEKLQEGAASESVKRPGAVPLAVQHDKGTSTILFLAPTKQQVKRAAPGGEGNVLDHFSEKAVERYLKPFDDAFASLPDSLSPRCFFNDSWEVFGANTTPDILTEFQRRRGYDLRNHLLSLNGEGDLETVSRVRSDYRETIGDLTRDAFLGTFANWSHKRGAKVRNQSHGSPANLLDLYAAADIPETEIFGPPRLHLAGLKALSPVPPDFGEDEEALACRMASSAAHVAGRQLCSSESFTWLGDHGHVTLEQMKSEVDTLFTLGINHLFFHGTPFSPADVEWPGWLFYAATLVAPTNTLWHDLPALNTYIARCQSLLQEGTPDSDVLFYFPYYDLLASDEGTDNLLHFLSVHKTGSWLRKNLTEFTTTANTLVKDGWSFDLVSDSQLSEMVTVTADGTLQSRGGSQYRALIIAGCHRMPPETLERIASLAKSGATVLIQHDLPSDIPGLTTLTERQARLKSAREALVKNHSVTIAPDIRALLEQAKITRESFTDEGLEFVRRRTATGHTYFVANPGKEDVAGWFPLTRSASSVMLRDAMTGASGTAATKTDSTGRTQVYLELPAAASVLLQTQLAPSTMERVPWQYTTPQESAAITLSKGWTVEFVEGGPSLPKSRILAALSDWTLWEDEALRNFSGTARYRITFDLPTGAADTAWQLDLGTVCHSAHVRLNDHEIGSVIAWPWHLTLPAVILKATSNLLEIEVTNLMANRLADLERRKGDSWRPFLMVNINYKPFDAASWPVVPSGLLGPVTLTPLRIFKPETKEVV
jgi:hypothetical protein